MRYLFPFKVMAWDTLATDSGQKLLPGPQMNAVGYIPVYDSIATLVRDHGNKVASGTFEARQCQKCGDAMAGHEDESATHCRWCVTTTADSGKSQTESRL